MPLSDVEIKNAKPGTKPYKLYDTGGLYLLVVPAGGKYCHLDYRFQGKRQTLALGVYPAVSLKDARERRDQARKLLANGINPSETRKAEKKATTNSFKAIALEWFAKREPGWACGHSSKVSGRLEKDIFPWLGERPITQITAPELLTVLRRVEGRGALDTAQREHQYCSQILRYAIATGRAEHDIAADLRGALAPATRNKHYPTITNPQQIGALLRAIDGYQGQFVTSCALRLAPLVFVRPGELRYAEWTELDLAAAIWKLPAEKMKQKKPHIVPLSHQAVAILRELYPLTGSERYLFPGPRTASRPISENTVNAALRRLGYAKNELTGHGFRGMASTLLHEQGFNRDWIEAQLAHAERNSVRGAYNHAEYLAERKRMMQHWADYLDGLRGGNVIPLRHEQH
ncbi:MAG: tyrosine-type recombinase/integrase [Gammaproteobacteria bacterium]